MADVGYVAGSKQSRDALSYKSVAGALQRVLDLAHIKGWRPEETFLRTVSKGLPRQNDPGSHFEAIPFVDVLEFFADWSTTPP